MRLTTLLLFVIFFCYASIAGLLFTNVLLPLVPSLHAGQGLLPKDAYHFHLIAVKVAETIRLDGWGSLAIWNYFAGTVPEFIYL